MSTQTLPNPLKFDEDLCDLIAQDVAAHHHRAEKLHFAETGSTEPIDEEREAAAEVARLLRMADPGLDGNETAAIERLKAALEDEVAHARR